MCLQLIIRPQFSFVSWNFYLIMICSIGISIRVGNVYFWKYYIKNLYRNLNLTVHAFTSSEKKNRNSFHSYNETTSAREDMVMLMILYKLNLLIQIITLQRPISYVSTLIYDLGLIISLSVLRQMNIACLVTLISYGS